MQCVSCLSPLGEGSDFDTFMCKSCVERKELSELSDRKRIFEWTGKYEGELNFDFTEHLGKTISIEIYERRKPGE